MFDIRIHRTILIQILKGIYSRTSLGPLLGFKGGTAAYLFHDLPRFSVDLDFDLLDGQDDQNIEAVFNDMKNVLQDFGKLNEASRKRNTLFFILSYSKDARNIKVEISKRNFGSRYEMRNYLGISMLVMNKEDIFANKLVALLERKKPAHRDLFDVWFFLKNNWGFNEGIVEKRTNLAAKEHLTKCIHYAENVSERHILAGMGELLDEKTKVWAKQNLKKDLLFLMKLKLQNI